jgi:FKBP-type peptidyl-prolyl cis-trans isomerase
MVECNEAVETYLENTSDQGSGPEIQAGDTIAVDYIGRLEAGEVFDTSVESVARACDSYNEARDYNA